MADSKVSSLTSKDTPIIGDIVHILDSENNNADGRTTLGAILSVAGDKYVGIDYSNLVEMVDYYTNNPTVYANVHITTLQNINANVTIPKNVTLVVHPGSIMTIADTKTLTINGGLEAGLYQVFTCTGTGKVVFGSGAVKEVYPQWWGFSTSATATNNTTYFTSMLLAFTNISPKVIIPAGSYSINELVINVAKLSIEGAGYRTVVLTYANSGSAVKFSALGINLENIEIDVTNASAVCVEIGPASGRFVIDQCWLQGPGTNNSSSCCIKFNQGASGSHNGIVRNTRLYRCYYGAYFAAGAAKCNETQFDKCTIYGNGTDMIYGIYDNNQSQGLKITNCDIENPSKTYLYSDGIGITVIGNRFEDTVAGSWEAYNSPPDTATRNPMLFGSNSEKVYVAGNVFFPTELGRLFASNGVRYWFHDTEDGISAGDIPLVGNIIYSSKTVNTIPNILRALSGQNTDLYQAQLSDGTVIYGLSKNAVPYDRIVSVTSSSGVLTCDCNTGRKFSCTMTENITSIAFTHGIVGMELTLTIVYGGAYTLPAIANWTDGGANQTYMLLGAAPSAPALDNRHILKFEFNGTRWVEMSRNLSVRDAP